MAAAFDSTFIRLVFCIHIVCFYFARADVGNVPQLLRKNLGLNLHSVDDKQYNFNKQVQDNEVEIFKDHRFTNGQINLETCASQLCAVVKRYREQYRIVRNLEKEPLTVRKDKVLSYLWNMYRNGQIKDQSPALKPFEMKSDTVTALVLGSCNPAIAHGKANKENTIIVQLFDDYYGEECVRTLGRNKVTNVYVSVTNPADIFSTLSHSAWGQSQKIFDSVEIYKVEALVSGLLPMEVEEKLSVLLNITHKLTVHFDINSDENAYFAYSWENPHSLMTKVCLRAPWSNCSVNNSPRFMETDWRKAVVSVNSAQYGDNHTSGTAPGRAVSLPVLMGLNLIEESAQAVFSSLLESEIPIEQNNRLAVKGRTITADGNLPVSKQINQASMLQRPGNLKLDPVAVSSQSPKLPSQQEIISLLNRWVDEKEGAKADGKRWNREDSELMGLYQKVISLNRPPQKAGDPVPQMRFDIVNGRPIEEQKIITKGYKDLGLILGKKSYKDDISGGVNKDSFSSDRGKGNIKRNVEDDAIRRDVRKDSIRSGIGKNVIKTRADKDTISSGVDKDTIKIGVGKDTIPRNLDKDSIIRGASKDEAKGADDKKNNRGGVDENSLKGNKDGDLKKVQTQQETENAAKQANSSKFSMRKLRKYERWSEAESNNFAQYVKLLKQQQDAVQNKANMRDMPDHSTSYVSMQKKGMKREEIQYETLWKIIYPYLKDKLTRDAEFTSLVAGDCYSTMLSTKLSLLNPNASVLTLISNAVPTCYNTFRSVVKSTGTGNNFMFAQSLSPDLIFSWSHTPQVFDVQVLGPEAFAWILSLGRDFPKYLGQILTLSRTTFIEVFKWSVIKNAINIFNISDLQNLGSFQDLVDEALLPYKVSTVDVRNVTTKQWKSVKNTDIYRINLSSFSRQVFPSCVEPSSKKVTMKVTHASTVAYTTGTDRSQVGQQDNLQADKGLRLQVLLSLQMDKEHRIPLFRSYLQLHVRTDMCPSQLLWRRGGLHHVDEINAWDAAEEAKIMTDIIKRELHQRQFSFMDYNSYQSLIGRTLAKFNPQSSFFLAVPNFNQVNSTIRKLKADRLTNTLVLELPITPAYSHNIMKSPDILRYQFIDFLKLMTESKTVEDFQKMFGEIVASGLTSFITVPSSQILSLAATTIFPDTFLSEPDLISDNIPAFEDAETQLLKQTARADIKIEINAHVHSSPHGQTDKMVHSWRLVTLKVMKLRLQVDHHFNFEIDQHERKYTQYVTRNSTQTQPVVYLRRQEDDYKINYGNVNAVSLIALMRMGLPTSTRDEFYGKFLNLPLYEDMAPWNIVFRAGNLEYIDQDTKDKTFDKMVPFAYQVMSVLINYERTIKDFGHCGESTSTVYNFNHIASCVRSNFQGPCLDSQKPVPCGDKTCKSTYIECLRALRNNLINSDTPGPQSEGLSSHSSQPDTWSFDLNGTR